MIQDGVTAGLLPQQPLETRLAAVIETAISTHLGALDDEDKATAKQKAAQAADEAWQLTYPTVSALEHPIPAPKRLTRTLKWALEAHEGMIVESQPVLRWIPTVTSDAMSFFRVGRDGLRSGRAWKKLVAEFGESVYYSRGKSSCKWNATTTVDWSEAWAPRTHGQPSHHEVGLLFAVFMCWLCSFFSQAESCLLQRVGKFVRSQTEAHVQSRVCPIATWHLLLIGP